MLAGRGVLDLVNPFNIVGASYLDSSVMSSRVNPHIGSLEHFHLRFGYFSNDTTKCVAQDPRLGINLTDNVRKTSVRCAQGKQIKNVQYKEDSGSNAPVGLVVSVICSV